MNFGRINSVHTEVNIGMIVIRGYPKKLSSAKTCCLIENVSDHSLVMCTTSEREWPHETLLLADSCPSKSQLIAIY